MPVGSGKFRREQGFGAVSVWPGAGRGGVRPAPGRTYIGFPKFWSNWSVAIWNLPVRWNNRGTLIPLLTQEKNAGANDRSTR
jgi:hypothetical protein